MPKFKPIQNTFKHYDCEGQYSTSPKQDASNCAMCKAMENQILGFPGFPEVIKDGYGLTIKNVTLSGFTILTWVAF